MSNFDLKQKRDALWHELVDATKYEPFAIDKFSDTLNELYQIDRFWTFPGRGVLFRLSHYLQLKQFALIKQLVKNCCYRLQHGRYRRQIFVPFETNLEQLDRPTLHDEMQITSAAISRAKPYFEVLIIHPFPDEYEMLYRDRKSVV